MVSFTFYTHKLTLINKIEIRLEKFKRVNTRHVRVINIQIFISIEFKTTRFQNG